ncbi:hypothetical protein LTR62_003098 [Meristemomyces frigidus]|uniref:DH domain-containing protein n=1 Tax=Meristemomyces frigidus TaxID=1508187 RepID=A0AAN7TGI4_9PEZI|nr:hypothetical protein LTR62_003098 [Meristemomyces frigidus]
MAYLMRSQRYTNNMFSRFEPLAGSELTEAERSRRRNVRSSSIGSLSSGDSSALMGSQQETSKRRKSVSAMFGRSSDRMRGADTGNDVARLRLRLLDVDEGAEGYSVISDLAEFTASEHSIQDSVDDGPVADFDDLPTLQEEDDGATSPAPAPSTFGRWLSTLKRRKGVPTTLASRTTRWTLDDFDRPPVSPRRAHNTGHRRHGSQTSSMALVTTLKSASVTLATTSIAAFSRRNSPKRGTRLSSLRSGSEARYSSDMARPHADDAALMRSHRRREKLAELLRTEEGYLADLKALSSHLPHCQAYIQQCASTTVSALITLHHALLSQLRLTIPFADHEPVLQRPSKHMRWYSTDGTVCVRRHDSAHRPERRSLNLQRSSSGCGEPLHTCEPYLVGAVTEIFRSRLPSFVAYDDFGEHYELIHLTVVDSQQSLENWLEYDAAFETLAHTLNPLQRRDDNQKRALRVRDLLIKPIQRLPRYLLLFQDLQKLTPVCDDPVVYAGLESVVEQLEAACIRLNHSRRSLDQKRVLNSTWLVSERLSFHNQLPRLAFLKLLGNVDLCGCLHIAYRSKDQIKGRYVICVLFDTTLLLATADSDDASYNVLAGIALKNVTMTETDNGRGLQCHTAPHSWKLVYEHQSKMYELVFTACSAPEAKVWREHISLRAAAQAVLAVEAGRGSFELFSPLVEDMKTVGKAMGKAGSFVRWMSQESIRRAATVASTTNLSQVIIKNTQACKETLDSSKATLQIPRSQSVATPSHVQTLAPRRADRVRLEALLSDVWTKDSLPYPGMTPRRSDPIRASANHVMRKFSMASITSNFSTSKRNVSHTSIPHARKEDMPPPKSTRTEHERSRPTRPLPVSFQTAPDAFLPEDFTIGGTLPKQKRSALRTLTMTLERPFSPAPSESKQPAPDPLRRTQSVRDVNRAETPPLYLVGTQSAVTPGLLSSMQDGAGVGEAEAVLQSPRKKRSTGRLLRMFA